MYLTDKSKNFESDFEEAKKQLQELHEHSIIFEELETSLYLKQKTPSTLKIKIL